MSSFKTKISNLFNSHPRNTSPSLEVERLTLEVAFVRVEKSNSNLQFQPKLEAKLDSDFNSKSK